METEEMKRLIMSARTPEAKLLLNYLLTQQAPAIMNREHELVFKGFMMAYFAIVDLQNQKITENKE